MKKQLLLLGFSLIWLASCQIQNTGTSHKTIKNHGVKIDYRIYGDSDTTLLFVHGWGINQTYWDPQVQYFSKKYKVVTFDLPGFGLSGKNRKNYSMEAYGDDVISLIKKLKLTQVILIGHSMGGNIILEAAVKHPKDIIGFIGIDNFKELGMEYTETDQMEINNFLNGLKENYANVASAFAEGALFAESTDTTVINRVIKDIKTSDPAAAISSIENSLRSTEREKLLMNQLQLKVLLVNSDVIPTNEEALEKYCKSHEIIPIHDTGHYPMIEKPEEFNRALQKAIDHL